MSPAAVKTKAKPSRARQGEGDDLLKNKTSADENVQAYLKGVLNLKGIKPDKEEKKEMSEQVKELVEKRILETMREEDPLFKAMFVEAKIAGSVQKGLKVEKSNEFDVNIKLRLLCASENVRVDEIGDDNPIYAGSYTCSFPRGDWNWPLPRKKHRKTWKNLLVRRPPTTKSKDALEEEEEPVRVYLSADGLRQWTQGLVSRALDKLDLKEKPRETRSGPAITLEVKIDGEAVSIDLVPVIHPVPESQRPLLGEDLVDITDGRKSDPDFHLVPVGPRTPRGFVHTVVEKKLLLRGTFPNFEKNLIERKESLKELIRIMKVVRNFNNWKPIASFYIVNLCAKWNRDYLKERKIEAMGETFHLQSPRMGENFVSILRALRSCLKERTLPLVLVPRCNLFINLKEEFCKNCSDRLDQILRRLDHAYRHNPTDVNKILDVLFRRRRSEGEVANNDDEVCDITDTGVVAD